jgi:hypothetical protein
MNTGETQTKVREITAAIVPTTKARTATNQSSPAVPAHSVGRNDQPAMTPENAAQPAIVGPTHLSAVVDIILTANKAA